MDKERKEEKEEEEKERKEEKEEEEEEEEERKEEKEEEEEKERKEEEEDCVWKHFSHEELERQYSPSMWSKYERQVIIAKHNEEATRRSEEARRIVGMRGDVVYDPSLPEGKLDVYGEDLDGASPILVYVHGGYWQELNKSMSAYLVPQLYKAGVVVVVIGYDLAPQVSMADIVKEVRKGVTWACELACSRGSVGVVLVGWCAGAQLIIQILSEEASRSGQTGVTPYRDLVKGLVSFSGIFDLRPLVTTYVNVPLKLTSEEAWALSPQRSVGELAEVWGGGGEGRGGLQVFLLVGEEESPEFKRQSREFYEACVKAGLPGEFLEVGEANHFSLVCDLFLPNFLPTTLLPNFVHKCCKG